MSLVFNWPVTELAIASKPIKQEKESMRKYNAPGHIERLMVATGHDWPRIVNAVQSELNKAVIVEDKTTRNAGLIKYTPAKKLADGTLKSAKVSWRETTGETYEAKATEPTKFAAWTDACLDLFAKQGEPSGELNEGFIPAERLVWLAVFKSKPTELADANSDFQREGSDKSDKSDGGKKRGTTPAPAPAK